MKNLRARKATLIESLEQRIAPAVVFAVEAGMNKLVSFDSAAPGVLKTDAAITGLLAGDIIAAIDFRPATGELYGLGIKDDGATRSGRIYKLDPTTAAATQVGAAPFDNTLTDTDRWGFDFDPVSDLIRLTNSGDQNLRVDPDTGELEQFDTTLDEAMTNEFVNAVAYDRNFGGNKTTLYGYDFNSDNLVTIGGLNGSPSPSGGVITNIARATLGGANFSASSAIGFDIAGGIGGADTGFLAMRQLGTTNTKFYTIDLATAALTDLGSIGNGARIFEGMSVQTDGIAPVISTNGKTATWRDLDGDFVTLKITKGTLTPANFRMLDGGGQTTTALSKLTLTGAQFSGTNITITAKRDTLGGDGRVNVGLIDATGVDLGIVTVAGDLIAIDAGTDTAPAPSIKSLTAASMGAFGRGPVSGGENATSTLADGAGKITITGDFLTNINLGKNKTGSVFIGGDVIGGTSAGSGTLSNFNANTTLGKLTIKGGVIAQGGDFAARIFLNGAGSVAIGGNIVGGDSSGAGVLDIVGNGKTVVTIGGSLIGGDGNISGALFLENVAQLKIGGNMIGGGDNLTGGIICSGGILSIAVKGSIIGGSGGGSAAISASGNGAVLKSLTVGGSIISTGQDVVIDSNRFGTVQVGGDIAGYDGGEVRIIARGNATPATAAESLAIGKITVGGDMRNAIIAAGLETSLASHTADAAIGAVKIGGSMIASSIAAGIEPKNGHFGDAGDGFPGGNNGNSAILAKIASITIGGQLLGTAGGAPDSFGIIAEQIGALTVNKNKQPLTAAKDEFTLGFTGDVRVREV